MFQTETDILNYILKNEIKILNLLAVLMFICGFIVYVILLYQPATYGRYSSTGRFYSIAVPAKVAWFLQEVPAFLVSTFFVVYSLFGDADVRYTPLQLGVLSFYIGHYFLRSFIYPLFIVGGKPTPVYAFLLAFLFCTVNGYMQARSALLLSSYSENDLPRVVIGTFLFLLGFLINQHSDHVLRNLRKPGETGYKIPKGGCFELVSCANFFGEILEWFGFAVASWNSCAAAFAFFTAANLIPRALCHHRFYQEKFEDYPKTREAVIPYLL